MKKIFFLLMLSATFATAKTQPGKRFAWATAVGTGVAVSKPASVPFTWRVSGYYSISERFTAGIGSGVSFYEKALIPVFAEAKFAFERGRKFTPYLACGVGYSLAPDKEAKGGFYLNPSVGVQYSWGEDRKLFGALGLECQKLERLKRLEQTAGVAEFAEKLNHATFSATIGFIF